MKNSIRNLTQDTKQPINEPRSFELLSFDHIPLEQQVVLLFPGQGAQFVGMGKQVSE